MVKCFPVEDGCILFMGAYERNGYSKFYRDGKMQWSHRVSYELSIGPIPAGLELDHVCRKPLCVNPRHLEPVTKKENQRRSPLRGAFFGSKTHCPFGHPYDQKNTYRYKGSRFCRKCRNRRVRAWEAKQAGRQDHHQDRADQA